MKNLTTIAVLLLASGCAIPTHVATSRIDEEDVEIMLDTSSSRPTEAEWGLVQQEAALRCGYYGRRPVYVSVRVNNLTPQGSFVTHLRYIYLFQCVKDDALSRVTP